MAVPVLLEMAPAGDGWWAVAAPQRADWAGLCTAAVGVAAEHPSYQFSEASAAQGIDCLVLLLPRTACRKRHTASAD